MYIVVDRTTRLIFALETLEPRAGAYPLHYVLRVQDGDAYPLTSTLTAAQLTELAWKDVRERRNQKLRDTDRTMLEDATTTKKNDWKAYRQALRDVTAQPDPLNISWPAPPETLETTPPKNPTRS